MLNLSEEVVEVKFVLADFLLQAARLFFVKLLLGAFHEADDIAHAEDTVRHTRRMEHINGFHLLARTDKLNRLCDNGADTDCRSASGVTVKFCQHHAVEVESVIKLFRRIDCILTGHRVNDKQCLVRINRVFQRLDFVHHLFVNGKTSCGIYNNDVTALRLCLFYGVLRYLYNVLIIRLRVNGHVNLRRYHFQLLYCGRTVHVAGNEHRVLMTLVFQHICKFSAECCLSGALQTGHKDYRRASFKVKVDALASHQFCQLIMHELNHQLSGFYGSEHIHAKRFLLNVIGEVLCHLIVNVGIKQRTSYVFQRFGDVYLGYFALSFKQLKGTVKSLT